MALPKDNQPRQCVSSRLRDWSACLANVILVCASRLSRLPCTCETDDSFGNGPCAPVKPTQQLPCCKPNDACQSNIGNYCTSICVCIPLCASCRFLLLHVILVIFMSAKTKEHLTQASATNQADCHAKYSPGPGESVTYVGRRRPVPKPHAGGTLRVDSL